MFSMLKKYTFYVSGTHCASCKILIEDVLREQEFVKNVRVNLKDKTVEVETNDDSNSLEIIETLNPKIKTNGYTLSVDRITEEKKQDDVIWKAIPIGFVFLLLFYLLQKSGILNFGLGSQTTPITSFIVGIVASLSSCLAVVGGLVLSLSAKVAKDDNGKTKKPFILFHAGRLIGFAVLGGLLGLLGKALGVSFIFSAILGIIASLVMILLGINLLGLFKGNFFTLPDNIFSAFRKAEHATLAPVIIGLGTFFLPCGFTQSMQIVALSSGSFISGSLIMLFFALGTFPVLALLSFGSVSFAQSKQAPLFFKSAGIVVVFLALFNLINSLVVLGIIPPVFNF